MNIKSITRVVATMFVHFKDPATDAPMFKDGEDGKPDSTKPVGVEIYGPGSKQYRTAQAAITTGNIKRGKKGLTGNTVFDNDTELLARTTIRFVNFDYEGKDENGQIAVLPENLDTYREFYNDVELAHLREQTQEKQGDLGNFTPTASNA